MNIGLEKHDIVSVPFKSGRRQYGILLKEIKAKAMWRVRIVYKAGDHVITEHRDIPEGQIYKLKRIDQIPRELLVALWADLNAIKLHPGSYVNSLLVYSFFDNTFNLNTERVTSRDHKNHFSDSPLAAKRLRQRLRELGYNIELRCPMTGRISCRIRKSGKSFVADAKTEEMALAVAALKAVGAVPSNAVCA